MTASVSSRPAVLRRCLMTSTTAGATPTFSASFSCAHHSNWLSISRAVMRIATSRTCGDRPASNRR